MRLARSCAPILLLLTAAAWCARIEAADDRPPSVVFILVDDLGWTDFGCFGSDLYQTPNIDQLAREGMKFTQAYSACTVCSPTRAALMTGKYPARLHVTDWIPGQMPANPRMLVPDWTKYLPLEEVTIAETLRAAGYATASIGKWHLGGEEYYPERQGFDLNIAGTAAPQPKTYFAPWNIPTISEGQPGEYLTDRLGDEAEKFIRASKDKPFFLYLAHFAVHLPIEAPKDVTEKYESMVKPEGRHRNAAYAAMIERLDATVGQVRQTLRELDLDERTILFITSDNGGRVPTTSNAPLRVGKGSAYEGGVRVPLIVFWPQVTKAGSECRVPVMTIDYYPTLLEITGAADLPGHQPDGVSIAPLLRGGDRLAREALYWHYPHHQHYQQGGAMPYAAVRAGDYRLIEFYDDGKIELYDLSRDVGEEHDLSSELPGKARELKEQLHAWQASVGAQMPTPNPAWDPTKPQHIPAPAKPRAGN